MLRKQTVVSTSSPDTAGYSVYLKNIMWQCSEMQNLTFALKAYDVYSGYQIFPSFTCI